MINIYFITNLSPGSDDGLSGLRVASTSCIRLSTRSCSWLSNCSTISAFNCYKKTYGLSYDKHGRRQVSHLKRFLKKLLPILNTSGKKHPTKQRLYRKIPLYIYMKSLIRERCTRSAQDISRGASKNSSAKPCSVHLIMDTPVLYIYIDQLLVINMHY